MLLYLWGEKKGPLKLCPRQGRDILRALEELPSRNVSVRLVTSIPSVRTNSTDLENLKQKGDSHTYSSTYSPQCVLIRIATFLHLIPHSAWRSSCEEGELWAFDEGRPPQQVLDCWQETRVYRECQHGLEGSYTGITRPHLWLKTLICKHWNFIQFYGSLPPVGEGTGSGCVQLLQPGKGPAQDFPVLLGDGAVQQLPATALACRVRHWHQPTSPPAGENQ